MVERKFGISDALESIGAGTSWAYQGDDISTLEWFDDKEDHPSNDEILAEVERLQEEYDALKYQRLRAAEYPDFRDYIDGVVKGDSEQVESYISACLAVKQKYPKPSKAE